MRQPPLLPEETLARVLRLAWFDGVGALVLGGIFALSSAASGQVTFAVIGLLASAAGAIELHGAALLRRAIPRGMNWLVCSQPFLWLVVVTYCITRLIVVELPPVPESLRDLFAASAQQWGLTLDEYRLVLNRITIFFVIALTTVFQGGVTLYYIRRREPVLRALEPD
jgi:hypothetical protein